MFKIFLFLASVFTFQAHAIAVNTCPDSMYLIMENPQISEGIAKQAYEEFFADSTFVYGKLKLAHKGNAQCEYRKDPDAAGMIGRAIIKGSFRQGAVEPATLQIFADLPFADVNGEAIGAAILYSDLEEVSPNGVILKSNTGSLYYHSNICSYGDCILDYKYLGYATVIVEKVR